MPRKRADAVTTLSVVAPETAKRMNKSEAIVAAMLELGKKASARDLSGFAMQKFGIEVTPEYVSVIKTNLKKRKKGGAAGRRMTERPSEGANGSRTVLGARGTPRTDFATVVSLARRLLEVTGGTDSAKRLLDALSE